MTPSAEDQKEILADMDRVIDENLRDPDLAATSLEFRAGYARGFREASLSFIVAQLEKLHG